MTIIDLPFETYYWKRSSRDILQYQRVQDFIHQPVNRIKREHSRWTAKPVDAVVFTLFLRSSEPLLLLKISPLHSGCPFQYLRSWRQGGLKQQSKRDWWRYVLTKKGMAGFELRLKFYSAEIKRTNHLNLNTLTAGNSATLLQDLYRTWINSMNESQVVK